MILQYVFYAVALCGLCYFVLARRAFDFTGLAFLASCFYFLPGFVGFVGYPEGVILRPVPLLPETYGVMSLVQGAILLSGIVSDLLPVSKVVQQLPTLPKNGSPAAGPIATLLAICGAVITFVTVRDSLTGHNKFLLLQELNRWYLLWTTCATLGAVIAYQNSMWILFSVNLTLMLLDLYVGFRVNLVVTTLTVLTLFLIPVGPQRLVRRWRAALLVLGLTVAMLVYKSISVAIKLANWELVTAQVTNPDAWRLILFHSEPFITQGILNEVIREHYSVGMTHLGDITFLLIPFSNEFGGEPKGFSDLFQPVIFSSVTDYGVGSNIWAEMLSSGGWYVLIISVCCYCAVLIAGGRILARLSGEMAAILAIVLVYWAFYIHRNDLLFQLTLMRRFFLAGVTIVALSMISGLAAREWRRAAVSNR